MQQQKVQEEQVVGMFGEPTGQAAVRFSELALATIRDPLSIEAEWRRLAKLPANSLHQGFDWCLAWSKAHGRELAIVCGTAGNRTLLILPLEIVLEKGIRFARFPGDRFNNINTGLFDCNLAPPDTEELRKFADALKSALRDKADLVVLDNVPLTWRDMRHPLTGLSAIENQNRSFQLPLLPDFEATIAQLHAKTRRKKFRSSNRKLEAIGGYDHIVATERGERHALLDLFFRQKGARLDLLGLPDVFQPPAIRDFFHRLMDVPVDGFDTPLVLHAIRLRGEHEGHVAAIAGLSRKGDHVLCQFGSIDESICPEASPGELLFWLMIERSCREGAAIFDFGVGEQPYKRNWCTHGTVQHDILLPLTVKGSLVRPLLIGVTRAKAAIKRNRHLYARVQRWRSGHGAATPKAAASNED